MPSPDNATTTNKTQSGVQSLEIGLSVLEVLIASNEPMMLKDIAQALQMHPAKSHRYLVSLIRKNYVCKLNDGRYGLGEKVNILGALGNNSLTQQNILAWLTHIANEIKGSLGCGVQIAKWFSEGPIIIQSVEANSPISIITRIGSRMPLTTSATGQLFASYQPDTLIKPLVIAEWQSATERSASLSAFNENSNTTTLPSDADLSAKWQHFTQRQATIRSQGYATVTGDMLAGINAISMPILPPLFASTADDSNVFDKNKPLDYAITVIGTAEQLPMHQQQAIADKIKAIAQRYQLTQ